MVARVSILGFLTSLALTGCGHGATPEATGTPAHFGHQARPFPGDAPATDVEELPRVAAAPPGPRDEPQAPPAPRDEPEAASRASAGSAAPSNDDALAGSGAPAELDRAEKKSRLGLGTSWGESVASRVSTTTFERQSDEHPFAAASFFYNDEAGVSAESHGRFVDWGDSVMPLANGNVIVSLVDESGRPLRAAFIDGRTTAIGHDGDRYIVRIDNRSPFRLETVASVDGLDVVDGGDGSFEKRGYVVGPYDTLDIEGFRESQGFVRAFRFGKVSDSYASRMGKDRNVGVVGVAIFNERGTDLRWTPQELQRRETANPFPGQFAPAPPSRWLAH